MRKQTPTEFQLRGLRLPVSDARFDRAMEMVARDMGGTYNRVNGTILLPKELTEGGRLPFSELICLYRKFPCGMLIKDVDRDNSVAGLPCVSFDVIPNVSGDPRRSKFYRNFQGDSGMSKRLFNQFVGWMAILSRAIKRYRTQLEAGRDPVFPRRVASADDVVVAWLLAREARGSTISRGG